MNGILIFIMGLIFGLTTGYFLRKVVEIINIEEKKKNTIDKEEQFIYINNRL